MTQGNRGMSFEAIIDLTNQRYDRLNLAVVNKRATPVKVLRITNGRITSGYYEQPSTVDYDGLIPGGRAIVFEAKSVASLSRFDLKNLKDHQVDYLLKCHKMDGIAFLLVEFVKQNKIYLLPYTALRYYWTAYKAKKGSSSISITDFEIHAYEVPKTRVPVDYLSVVNKLWQATGS